MISNRDSHEQISPEPAESKFGVHPDVLKLGLVSLLTDLSSEMIFSVFAIFFTTIAGASAALLGMVEGFADLSASSLNYFAGWWRTVCFRGCERRPRRFISCFCDRIENIVPRHASAKPN